MAQLATFARVYVSDLNEGVALFATDVRTTPRLKFSHASGLELALVGDVLILAGPQKVLDQFRSTQATVIVDDLDAAIAESIQYGGHLLREPASQPTGRNVTISYRTGAVIEYVEWSAAIREQVGL